MAVRGSETPTHRRATHPTLQSAAESRARLLPLPRGWARGSGTEAGRGGCAAQTLPLRSHQPPLDGRVQVRGQRDRHPEGKRINKGTQQERCCSGGWRGCSEDRGHRRRAGCSTDQCWMWTVGDLPTSAETSPATPRPSRQRWTPCGQKHVSPWCAMSPLWHAPGPGPSRVPLYWL